MPEIMTYSSGYETARQSNRFAEHAEDLRSPDTIENSSENALILWWCALVRTFVQFVPFVAIRDLLVLILSRMSRIDEWHESSKSVEIIAFSDRVMFM